MRRTALVLFLTLATMSGVASSVGAQDLDCADLTYAEAQEILAQNPSDPHGLDRDNDGEACETGGGGSSTGGGTEASGETTELPATGTGVPAVSDSGMSALGAVAVVLLIVGSVVRRVTIFRT